MTRTEAFRSGYLKQEDVPAPIIAIIKTVGMELMQNDSNGDVEKPVVHFNNGTKPIVANRIIWDTLENAYGMDSDAWTGKPVEIFIDPNVMYGGRKTGGIRIRIPAGDAAPINFEKAIEMAKGIGRSREDLITFFKSKGRIGYNHARDSGLVREFIANNSHAQIKEEDIPF